MRPWLGLRTFVLGAALGATGCVASDVGYSDVRRVTSERTGKDVRWRAFDDGSAAERRTRELLAQPLTEDAAVQLALLNNPGLQASFEQLGLARASLVRALRIPNPSAEGAVLFHDSSRPELQLKALEDLSEFIVMPLRNGAAKAELEATKAAVVAAVLDVGLTTRVAYYEHLAALQLFELQGTVLAATQASFEAARGLHDAGNITDLALATERALFEESRLGKARAETEVIATREKLLAELGLPTAVKPISLAPHLPELPQQELSVDSLERNAIAKSLDLSAARHRFDAAARRASYSRVRGALPQLGVGVEVERREAWGVGPAAAVSVPLFYQGQAEVAEASAQMRRERQVFADVVLKIQAAARATAARLTNARATVAYYRDVLIPLRSEIVDGALLQYNAMDIGVFQLLQAKRDQIATARAYVEGLRDYWVERARAEALLAGRLPSGAPTRSAPAVPAEATGAAH